MCHLFPAGIRGQVRWRYKSPSSKHAADIKTKLVKPGRTDGTLPAQVTLTPLFTFSYLLFIFYLLLFPFQPFTFSYFRFIFLPYPVHPTGFSFYFFPGFLAIFTLLSSQQQQQLHLFPFRYANQT